jgi:magnesium transporter
MELIAREKDAVLVGEELSSSDLLDSKTAQLQDLLHDKLEQAFHKQTSTIGVQDLAKIASEHSPVDLAYAACRLPSHARLMVYSHLNGVESKIEFLLNTDSRTRVEIFRDIGDLDIKALLDQMPPDDAVEVLEDLAERRFRRVVEMLDAGKAVKIKEIKKHRRNTAGRLMTNEFFAFPADLTVGEAALQIRNHPGIDLTRQIFVLNAEGVLEGTVPARNLIVNPEYLPLKQVMKPVAYQVSPQASREEVVEIVERYKVSALPVVDGDHHLLGVITHEDVLDAVQDINDETIASMAGTTEKVSEHETLLTRFFSRAPWLVVTLLAGLINVGIMSSFSQSHAGGLLLFVMFFVPLITGLSGNIGIQCSTVLVRGLALGLVSKGNRKETAYKELLVGLTSGTVFGVLAGFLVYSIDLAGVSHFEVSASLVGLIVGAGLTGACLAGTMLGVLSPLFFMRIGVDPAVASGPIVTAVNDFLSMSIYFLIALGLGALLF